jgi:hypothetical protein
MSGARVQSIDALKHFRIALWKFKEAANVAIGDAEGEVQRTVSWLQGEQQQFWQGQIRKRHEIVNRCKDAVRQKQLFKDSTGRVQSAVDELKALGIAQKRLAEAEQKLLNTKRHSAKLQKEMHMYKGAMQGFATTVASDLPNAVATLDRMVHSLEEYVSLTASGGLAESTPPPGSAAGVGSGEGSAMTRAEVEEGSKEATEAAAESGQDEARVATGESAPDAPAAPG